MGSQYTGFVIQFITSVIISRFFLAPDEVGLFSIALAAAMMVAVLQDFGLTRYITGLARLDHEETARCSSVAVVFSWTVGLAIAAASPAVASFYGHADLLPILLIIALSYGFSAFSIMPVALLSREMAFGRLFVVNVSSAFVQGGVAIGMAMAGFSALSLAWAMVASAAIRAIAGQALRPALPFPPRFDGLAEVLRFGSQSSYLFIIGAVGSRSADLIVGKFLSLAATGIYTRSTGLASQLRTLVSGGIGSVVYPSFARIQRRGGSLAEPYLKVVACFTASTWPVMAGLAIGAEPLVESLFGPRWIAVAPILQLIAISEMLFEALPMQMEIPILHGEMKKLTRRNILDTIVSVTLLIAGAMVSVEMAAVSRIAYAAIWIFIYVFFICGLIDLSPLRLVRIYAKGLVATVAAIVPLSIAALVMPDFRYCGIATLGSFALMGAPLWLAALWLLRHPLWDEIVSIGSGFALRLRARQA
nr:oligosaccharide flippase family protein [Alteraurantiacibacter aestuarii]